MYKLVRNIIAPLLRMFFRIEVIGLENVPKSGGVIFAANHQAVIDSFVIPAVINRRFTYLAKSEFFTAPGIKGRIQKWFFSIGAVPVDRDDRNAGVKATELMVDILRSGGAVGIHPEGTRAPDAKIYRGKRGVIEIAWRSGAPVIPVALLGTRKANPPGSIWPHIGAKITIIIGESMYFSAPKHEIPGMVTISQSQQVKDLMEHIAELADWDYLHIDARKAKMDLMRD